MDYKTVPVSRVPATLLRRLDGLKDRVAMNVTDTAAKALDRSTLCRLAIEDFLGRYENEPMMLVGRLGFQPQSDPEND
jgi:hypothetical protein